MWSRTKVLTGSICLIVCFWPFWVNFRPIFAEFRPKMCKYDPIKLFCKIFMDKMNSEDETLLKSWSLVLFITIWPFWTYFGPFLGQFWITYGPNLGFNTQYMHFYMKNNALLFKWSEKMVLTDSVSLIVCFWLFCANFGPILAQFRPKIAKYGPVKQVSKIFR